ncbi:MAG: integrase [Hydrococcus sp. RU_2_2]|nr:integrase [Hydrococcus sp. RU_2_2]
MFIHLKHYSYKIEISYIAWIKYYILFHNNKRHPRDITRAKIEVFLTYLAVEENVATSTQNQVFNTIFVFVYRLNA